jgi:hypothetical protein
MVEETRRKKNKKGGRGREEGRKEGRRKQTVTANNKKDI